MVRSNGRKKRGMQQGVGKRKGARGSRTGSSIYLTKSVRKLLEKVAEKCFHIFAALVCATYLAPLQMTGRNQFELLQGKRKLIFYAVSLFAAGLCAPKVKAFVDLVDKGAKSDFTTFISFVIILFYLVPYATAVGVLIKPKETMELVHDWPNLLSCVEEATDRKLTPFSDVSAALKVLIAAGGTTVAFIGDFAIYLRDASLPSYFHSQFKDNFAGLYSLMPGLIWKLIFLPIDGLSIGIAVPLIAFVGITLSMEFGALKSYLKELSSITVNASSHAKVHHLYNCFRLHNGLSAEWFKFVVCPIIFSQSFTIIICLYMTIKHPEMPALIFASFLITACALLAILVWSGLDMIAITTAGECFIQSLRELQHMDFMKMTKMEKMEYKKRAMAIRKPSFPVGNFTELDFDVIIAVWEEILNQLLFLLSF